MTEDSQNLAEPALKISPAELPQELFPYILNYVGTDPDGNESESAKRCRDLKECSLVCLDWGNRCRSYMFSGGSIIIRSATEFATLDFYADHGSDRLVPLLDLIRVSTCEQNWDGPSWVHRTYRSRFFAAPGNESNIVLRGPLPSRLPRSAYHSPHWSIPRSLPTCYLRFVKLHLYNIDFPRFSDLHALIRHFTMTETFVFESLSWIGATGSLPRLSTVKTNGRCNRVQVHRCADHVALSLLTCHLLIPPSEWLFSYMGTGEVRACDEFLRSMLYFDLNTSLGRYSPRKGPDRSGKRRPAFFISRGIEPNKHLIHDVPRVRVDLDRSFVVDVLSMQGATHVRLDVQCETDLAPQLSSDHIPVVTAMRVVGLRLQLDSHARDDDSEQQRHVVQILQALHRVLPSFLDLRAVEVHAKLGVLRHAVRMSPGISNIPMLNGVLYRWGCPPSDFEDLLPEAKGYSCIGVDPATLELSGLYWDFSVNDAIETAENHDTDNYNLYRGAYCHPGYDFLSEETESGSDSGSDTCTHLR